MQQTKKMDEPIKNFCTDALLFDIKKLLEWFEIGRTIKYWLKSSKFQFVSLTKKSFIHGKVAASIKTIYQQYFPLIFEIFFVGDSKDLSELEWAAIILIKEMIKLYVSF